MKTATHKWNIRVIGETKPISYYGYPTKKQAQKFADEWNAKHELKVEVIKY